MSGTRVDGSRIHRHGVRSQSPFNDLPDLPPASETETKAVLRSCIAARAALAELRVSGTLIPNQTMLINSIPLLKARASSEIENIVTTADRLFRHANDATGRADPAFCLTVTGPTGCPPASAAR